jgi:phytoene/squalene synthetase
VKLKTTSQSAFYQTHLNSVSRSFALCIAQLKEPLRNRIGLAYLICRIIDTVEDSKFSTTKQKLDLMKTLDGFVRKPPSKSEVHKWVDKFPTDIIESEKLLLNDAAQILSDLHKLPAKEKNILKATALSMSRGMAYFLKRNASKNTLVLSSVIDVNRYCFFVAGVVGEMLTRLLNLRTSKFKLDHETLKRAHQFGLFLQKINLLKDQLADQKEGRNLVPSHELLWRSLKPDLEGAFQYLLAIPVKEKDYRIFCGWSLFLGLASTPWIRKTWFLKIFNKIPRAMTRNLLDQVSAIIDDNSALTALYEKMVPKFSDTTFIKSSGDINLKVPKFKKFNELYHGKFSQ